MGSSGVQDKEWVVDGSGPRVGQPAGSEPKRERGKISPSRSRRREGRRRDELWQVGYEVEQDPPSPSERTCNRALIMEALPEHLVQGEDGRSLTGGGVAASADPRRRDSQYRDAIRMSLSHSSAMHLLGAPAK